MKEAHAQMNITNAEWGGMYGQKSHDKRAVPGH